MGQKPAVSKIAREPRQEWPLVIALNPRTCELHKLAVFNSRRARRFARAAIQALIYVLDKRYVHRRMALVHADHLLNSAPRRICFQMPQPIGWAMIQAQAAMHAARVVFIDRLQSGDAVCFAHKITCLPRSARERMCHSDRMPS